MNTQRDIEKYLRTVDQATLQKIVDNMPEHYWENAHKHVGEILNRMVDNKKVERVKRGVYKWIGSVKEIDNLSLF